MTAEEDTSSPLSSEHAQEIVAGGDVIDELSHVSNIAYLRWIQEAAKAHSTAVGWDSERYFALGAVFVVRRHEIDYLAPVLLGERVRVVTWIQSWSAATSERRTRIEKVDGGAVVVRAKTLWAMIDFQSGRPRRVPREIQEAFLQRRTD